MTCANWALTVLALVTFAFGVWPFANLGYAYWLIGIASLLTLIVAWTGVKCNYCKK